MRWPYCFSAAQGFLLEISQPIPQPILNEATNTIIISQPKGIAERIFIFKAFSQLDDRDKEISHPACRFFQHANYGSYSIRKRVF